MSVSQLSDKNVGYGLGLAYLSDIVAGGGVASITDENGNAVVGDVNIVSSDASIVITCDPATNEIDITTGAVPVAGVSSISFNGGATTVNGVVEFISSDSSVQFSAGLAGQIDFQVPVPVPVQPPMILINMVEGINSLQLTEDKNNSYFCLSTATATTILNITVIGGYSLPVGYRIWIKNSSPPDAVINRDILIRKDGNPIPDISGCNSFLHVRGNTTSINTAWVALVCLSENNLQMV